MALDLVAERLDDVDGKVRYRLCEVGGSHPQVVAIADDGADVEVEGGAELSWANAKMLTKLLRLRSERGGWPMRAGRQS